LSLSLITGPEAIELPLEAAPDNLTARKKGEEEESPFRRWKGQEEVKGVAAEAPSSSSNANILFATLSALLSMSIPPPSSQIDVPRVVEDLKANKAWFDSFEVNQVRVMAEAIAKERTQACHTE
jgi:hypothetical protein